MKAAISAEIKRIAGHRLSTEMCGEIADQVIKIMEDINRKAALVAIETVKEKMVQDASESVTRDESKTAPA